MGFAVFAQVMNEGGRIFGWQGAYKGTVCFLGGFGAELFVHAGQGFGGAGQQHHAAHGSVEAVNETHEGFAGFVVFGGKVIRDYIQQVHITGYIALYGKSGGFVHRNEVVVFVKNFGLHGAKVVKTGLICEPSGFGAYPCTSLRAYEPSGFRGGQLYLSGGDVLFCLLVFLVGRVMRTLRVRFISPHFVRDI